MFIAALNLKIVLWKLYNYAGRLLSGLADGLGAHEQVEDEHCEWSCQSGGGRPPDIVSFSNVLCTRAICTNTGCTARPWGIPELTQYFNCEEKCRNEPRKKFWEQAINRGTVCLTLDRLFLWRKIEEIEARKAAQLLCNAQKKDVTRRFVTQVTLRHLFRVCQEIAPH